jgi:hypothetical protein
MRLSPQNNCLIFVITNNQADFKCHKNFLKILQILNFFKLSKNIYDFDDLHLFKKLFSKHNHLFIQLFYF